MKPHTPALVPQDTDCTAFLQWALPRLELRWPGFRKVRRQVCKRLGRRIDDLHLPGFAAYRQRLEADPGEWRVVDESCHITISRFFRDRRLFEVLSERVLPEIAARARREGRGARFWSAGCASGEEPYTLKILWELAVAPAVPGVALSLIATDIDAVMLGRAQRACFAETSLRELPASLVERAFDRVGSHSCVKPAYRKAVEFVHQDLRAALPPGPFDLVLCRNVAFTYFSLPLQERVLERIVAHLVPNGYLVIGAHERLPGSSRALSPLAEAPQIFATGALR